VENDASSHSRWRDAAAALRSTERLLRLARNAGTHAGGVVIAPGPLTDFTALYCEPGSQGVVTQLDKDDVEQVGLVKFDFLGLRTLTIIDWALKLINARKLAAGEAPVDLSRLPLDDAETFRLLKSGRTAAIFRGIFFSSAVLSVTIVTLIWRLMLVPDGGLLAKGADVMGSAPIPFLSDPNLVMPAMAIASISWCGPHGVLPSVPSTMRVP